MGEWADEARAYKLRRTRPPLDDWDSRSTAKEKPKQKAPRPWKIEYRIHPKEMQRQREQSWFWSLWSRQRNWGTWGAYKTENARDQSLASMQRRNQAYWQYRKKDPK